MDLRETQSELDERKYNSSILARCDMSGKMDYCKDCIFRNELPSCDINHEIRKNYKVCERNYKKLKERESDKPRTKRASRKVNNG